MIHHVLYCTLVINLTIEITRIRSNFTNNPAPYSQPSMNPQPAPQPQPVCQLQPARQLQQPQQPQQLLMNHQKTMFLVLVLAIIQTQSPNHTALKCQSQLRQFL